MRRRAFVSALVLTPALGGLALSTGSGSVRADAALPPPPSLEVRPHATSHAGPGAPTSAQWEIRNGGRARYTIEPERAVLLLPRMRLPLRMSEVRVGGRPATGPIAIAPGRTVIVEVTLADFSDAAAGESAWEIELSMSVRGGRFHSGRAQGTTRVTRARTASR